MWRYLFWIEDFLEENKENLNFEFIDMYDPLVRTTESHYVNLWSKFSRNKLLHENICLECYWNLTSKFNNTPLGDVILTAGC